MPSPLFATARVLLVACVFVPALGRAERPDPDTEVATRHYQDGARAYEARDYARALEEFQAAARLRPSPALSYNIARAYDRMGQWEQAADNYQRFVDGLPDVPEAASARDRIVQLRERLPERTSAPIGVATPVVVATPAARRPLHRRAWVWGVVGGVAGVGLAVGLGVGLGVHRDPTPTYGKVRGDP